MFFEIQHQSNNWAHPFVSATVCLFSKVDKNFCPKTNSNLPQPVELCSTQEVVAKSRDHAAIATKICWKPKSHFCGRPVSGTSWNICIYVSDSHNIVLLLWHGVGITFQCYHFDTFDTPPFYQHFSSFIRTKAYQVWAFNGSSCAVHSNAFKSR